jgi:hypothetical protein
VPDPLADTGSLQLEDVRARVEEEERRGFAGPRPLD